MLEGYALEVTLTTANSAAQAWYGYDQVSKASSKNNTALVYWLAKGIIAGILISPHFLKAFPQLSTPSIEGIFISSFALGNLVGCILTALLGDWLGRKKTLWIGASISATGGILQAAAYSFPMLMLGRVVSGLGNGMYPPTIARHETNTNTDQAWLHLLAACTRQKPPVAREEARCQS
jgi:MFS family permease